MGGVGKVEFGVHVDEVVGEERREGDMESFENVGMGGSAEEEGMSGDDGFQEGA